MLALHVIDPVYEGVQDHLFAGIDNDPGVTLVAIDQTSSDRLPPHTAWPWSNSIHARVIDNLAKLHPKAILVDIVLNRSDAGDGELAGAIARAGNVVLACTANDVPAQRFALQARFVQLRWCIGQAQQKTRQSGLVEQLFETSR